MSYRKTDRTRPYGAVCGSAIVGVALVMLASACARAAPGDLLLTIPQPEGASGSLFGTLFGYSVAADDGQIIVGAPEETVDGVVQAGAAYVFDSNSGKLIERLTRSVPGRLLGYGQAVAADSGRIFVGTRGAPVDVYDGLSREFLREIVTQSRTMAARGDKVLTADYTLRVGGIIGVGGANLFDAVTGELETRLPNPEPPGSHFFGSSVAFFGDRPVVGASLHDTPMTFNNIGRAYVLDPLTGQPVLILENPFPEPDAVLAARFGESVATTEGKVIVGAPTANANGVPEAGAAYAFDGTYGELLFTMHHPDPVFFGQFGDVVATVGGNILVGNPDEEAANGRLLGSVYLYDGQTGEFLLRITNPDPETSLFGSSITELDGNIVISGRFARAVYVFEGVPDIPVGDTDADGDVDVDDLNAVRNHFGQLGPDDGTLAGDTWPYDGTVTIDDLNRIRNYFGNTRHPASNVPEPASAAMVLIGILSLATSRRRAGGRGDGLQE